MEQLDSFDLKILRILQRDNLTSQRAIAEQVALSAAAVQRRIQRLHALGIIDRDVAVIAPAKVGRPITLVIEVTLESERSDVLAELKRAFCEAPEVQQCYYVTGEADFILIVTARDMKELHRNIKPGNILLDAGGHGFVTDFGISSVTSRPDAAALGETVGTPYYMPPEQAMGEAVDGRADVYSLGVVLFEMLTGRVPFEGRNLKELIAKHISAPVPSVADLEPGTPKPLVALVQRMMAKEPAQRPDAAELVQALEAATTPIALLTPGQVRRRRWRRRGIIGAVAVATVALVIWSCWSPWLASWNARRWRVARTSAPRRWGCHGF